MVAGIGDIGEALRLTLESETRASGARIRFWVKEDMDIGGEKSCDLADVISVHIHGESAEGELEWLATTGPWSLFEAVFKASDFEGLTFWRPVISTTCSKVLYVDDIKVQPLRSLMSCVVYDEEIKMIAAFDDDHFGVYPQYNQRNEWVRTRLETLDGIKTVSEQHLRQKHTD